MIIYSKVTTAPTSEPVTLDEIKEFLKIDGTAEDALLTILRKSAREKCEHYSGLSFITQDRQITLDKFPCGRIIELPNGPVSAVADIDYFDSDGVAQTLTSGTHFIVDTNSDVCRIQVVDSWPSVKDRINAITISYTAGHTDDNHDPVPSAIKQAILMEVASMYENRQNEVVGATISKLNTDSEALLDTVKVYSNANA